MRTTSSPASRCLVLLTCLVLGGCDALDPSKARQVEADRKAVTRQWHGLRELVETFAGVIEDGGRRIAAASDDLEIKRGSVLYRMRATETARQLLWFDRPAEAMVDLWTLCVQLTAYFTEGDGKEAFGPQQPIAVEVTKQLLKYVESFMAKEIKKDPFPKIREQVYEFARQHPIAGSYARFSLQPSDVAEKEKTGLLAWLPSVSLNPFGTFGKGLGEGAQAILAFSKVADRFTDVVEFLPVRLGWRLELLQYDLAESKLLGDATGSVADASASVKEIAKTAKDLPASVRVELEKAFASLDPKLKAVQATLDKVTEASATLDRTGETYDQAAKSFEAMAQKVDVALQTFQKLMVFFRGDPDKQTGDETAKPFEILQYAETARSVTAMAEQLQETLTTFQQLIADDRLGGRVADASAEARKTVETLIWTGGLGVVSSVAAILILLLIYRLFAPRSKAQPEPQPPR